MQKADGHKHSFREIGEELGVTTEGARRIVKRAIETIGSQNGRAICKGSWTTGVKYSTI